MCKADLEKQTALCGWSKWWPGAIREHLLVTLVPFLHLAHRAPKGVRYSLCPSWSHLQLSCQQALLAVFTTGGFLSLKREVIPCPDRSLERRGQASWERCVVGERCCGSEPWVSPWVWNRHCLLMRWHLIAQLLHDHRVAAAGPCTSVHCHHVISIGVPRLWQQVLRDSVISPVYKLQDSWLKL